MITIKSPSNQITVSSKDSASISINSSETKVLASTPTTVFKSLPANSEVAIAVGQIMSGQFVVLLNGGRCEATSSDDERAIFHPLRIAKNNVSDGEELILSPVTGQHSTPFKLEPGRSVFINEHGFASSDSDGTISIGCGVATSTNTFIARDGLRIKTIKE